MKTLLFHQHLVKSAKLNEGRLLLIDSATNKIANTYIATSGLPNYQTVDGLCLPGRGAIPQNNSIGLDRYTVDTSPLYLPNVKGVEGDFYKIRPDTVSTSNGTLPGDFGIHFDANVPGSSGCVVLRTNVGWEAFKNDIQALLAAGTREIALLVSYSR